MSIESFSCPAPSLWNFRFLPLPFIQFQNNVRLDLENSRRRRCGRVILRGASLIQLSPNIFRFVKAPKLIVSPAVDAQSQRSPCAKQLRRLHRNSTAPSDPDAHRDIRARSWRAQATRRHHLQQNAFDVSIQLIYYHFCFRYFLLLVIIDLLLKYINIVIRESSVPIHLAYPTTLSQRYTRKTIEKINKSYGHLAEVGMPRNENNGRAAPSAPPIHMMPSSSSDHSRTNQDRDRSPPPRYEEAIADEDRVLFTASSDRQQSQHQEASNRSPVHRQSPRRSSRRSASCNPTRTASPLSPTSARRRRDHTHVTERRNEGPNRYRSASPGYLSENSHDNQSDGTQQGERDEDGEPKRKRKQRGSGSKIKKGLENIAFFIIQILD